MSPTARCLKDLREDGWHPWIVERWCGRIKVDLYGCIDILALKGNITLAVQVTAGSCHAARATKTRESQWLQNMLDAGWVVEVWSYRKSAKTGRYVRRIERIEAQEPPGEAGKLEEFIRHDYPLETAL